MKTRLLGTTGIAVSAVGLGCNSLGGRIDLEASRRVVHAALDLGITFFDTANTYGNRYGSPGGSERALGELLGARRKDVVLATKFGSQSRKHESIPVEGASRAEVMAAAHASLKRLRTDWIDLYQLHYPDPHTPMDETLRALDDLVQQGKVRHVGCSNFAPATLDEAQRTARRLGLPGFVTCQKEYSVLARGMRDDLLPVMEEHGVALLPYYPLAAGMLTGKYAPGSVPAGSRLATQRRLSDRFLTDDNLSAVARLRAYSVRQCRTLLELAFGWLLAQPAVACVIAGATHADQVAANVAAAGWAVTPPQMADIDELAARTDVGGAALSPTGGVP